MTRVASIANKARGTLINRGPDDRKTIDQKEELGEGEKGKHGRTWKKVSRGSDPENDASSGTHRQWKSRNFVADDV